MPEALEKAAESNKHLHLDLKMQVRAAAVHLLPEVTQPAAADQFVLCSLTTITPTSSCPPSWMSTLPSMPSTCELAC